MGYEATRLSYLVIVTSDNLRTEEPAEIIRDICTGIKRENYITEVNREKAIALAVSAAKKGDVILLAGKGHEDYQLIQGTKHHYSDQEVVRELLGCA